MMDYNAVEKDTHAPHGYQGLLPIDASNLEKKGLMGSAINPEEPYLFSSNRLSLRRIDMC